MTETKKGAREEEFGFNGCLRAQFFFRRAFQNSNVDEKSNIYILISNNTIYVQPEVKEVIYTVRGV